MGGQSLGVASGEWLRSSKEGVGARELWRELWRLEWLLVKTRGAVLLRMDRSPSVPAAAPFTQSSANAPITFPTGIHFRGDAEEAKIDEPRIF